MRVDSTEQFLMRRDYNRHRRDYNRHRRDFNRHRRDFNWTFQMEKIRLHRPRFDPWVMVWNGTGGGLERDRWWFGTGPVVVWNGAGGPVMVWNGAGGGMGRGPRNLAV